MKLSLSIVENNQQIYKAMLTAMLPECKSYMLKVVSYVRRILPPVISSAIVNREEYISLVSGRLRLELGIPDAAVKVSNLIEFWIQNIDITYSQPAIFGSEIRSTFNIGLIKSDFSDILGSDYAYVVDNIYNYRLPWLEWLLLDGNKSIVKNHEVIIKTTPRSRTGGAVMVPSTASWSVPQQYAGTISDNWITRAIDDAEPDILSILEKAVDQ